MASSILPWIGERHHHGAAGTYAGGVVTGVLFAAAGGAAGVAAVPVAGLFVGQLGLLRLGMECYLATQEPPPGWFGLPNT